MPTTNTSILKTTKKNIQEGKIFVALSRLRQACIYPWELAELTSQFQACLQHYALCTNSSQLPNSFNYTILINNNFDPQSNKNWQAFGEWISSKYGTCETDPLVTPVSFDRKSIELLLANILPNSKNLMHLASALAISQITNTPNLINKDWIDHAFSKDKIPNFFIRAITEWQIRSELASKILDLQASTISALFNSLSIQWDYFHSSYCLHQLDASDDFHCKLIINSLNVIEDKWIDSFARQYNDYSFCNLNLPSLRALRELLIQNQKTYPALCSTLITQVDGWIYIRSNQANVNIDKTPPVDWSDIFRKITVMAYGDSSILECEATGDEQTYLCVAKEIKKSLLFKPTENKSLLNSMTLLASKHSLTPIT